MRFGLVSLTVILVGVFVVIACRAALAANAGHDPIVGLWVTEDQDATVELYECDRQICGRFSWLKDIRNDIHNPDPKKRNQSLCNMQFIGEFNKDEAGHYSGGWIYNPEDGATYDAEMKLIDHDMLHLHGYVVVPLFGQSQVWKRTLSSPDCNTRQG